MATLTTLEHLTERGSGPLQVVAMTGRDQPLQLPMKRLVKLVELFRRRGGGRGRGME